MKPGLILLFSIFFSVTAFCQANKIYLYADSGRIVDGSVKEIGRYTITYSMKGNKVFKAVSRHAVQKITDSLGNGAQAISPFIAIRAESDWLKVVILDDKSETVGLQYTAEISGKGGGKFVEAAPADSAAFANLRKAAARQGCPFVYISKNRVKHTGYVGRRIVKSGVAYRY